MRTGRLKEDYVAGKSMEAGQRVTILEEMAHSYRCVASVDWEFYVVKQLVELDQPACDAPAWHDVPTCAGWWWNRNCTTRVETLDLPPWITNNGPWFGPIPECPR